MVRVLHVQYANPGSYPPLRHVARILAGRGARVRFLGVEVAAVSALRLAPGDGVEVRLLGAVLPGWRQKAHYLGFAAWALWHTLRWRPHAVYVSDTLAAPVGLLLRRFARVVYHEHDAPDPVLAGRGFGRICLAARRRLAAAAAAVVVPNAERGRILAGESGRAAPVHVVWNCPERAEASAERGAPEGPLRVVFHGNISPEILPLTVIDAIARVEARVELRVVGYEPAGARGHIEALRSRAAELGVEDRIRFDGPMARADLLRVCALHDAGLSLMPRATGDANLKLMLGASNKSFEYLACGVAPIVSDLPEWRDAFVEPGYALACDPADAASIAAA
ncbi:MAG TPA: glycosyltransferase, partial [Longimicrobium sp.]